MRLTLGSRTYDLTTRAVVVDDSVYATAEDDASLDRALGAGAILVRMSTPTVAMLERCAAAGVAVVVPAEAVDMAGAAGLPPDKVVPEALWLDASGRECPVAVTAVGVIRGARVVRTTDVRGARRVCDVLAAVLEAR